MVYHVYEANLKYVQDSTELILIKITLGYNVAYPNIIILDHKKIKLVSNALLMHNNMYLFLTAIHCECQISNLSSNKLPVHELWNDICRIVPDNVLKTSLRIYW